MPDTLLKNLDFGNKPTTSAKQFLLTEETGHKDLREFLRNDDELMELDNLLCKAFSSKRDALNFRGNFLNITER